LTPPVSRFYFEEEAKAEGFFVFYTVFNTSVPPALLKPSEDRTWVYEYQRVRTVVK
jgi:hypothetical protein